MLSKSETDEFLIAQQFKENALADLMKIYCTSDMNPTCRSFKTWLHAIWRENKNNFITLI